MSTEIARPWALMRHHRGWADIFHIEAEAGATVTGRYPDRDADEEMTLNNYAVLARFESHDDAKAARDRGLAERRRHDPTVDAAEAALKAAEQARDEAWMAALKGEGVS